ASTGVHWLGRCSHAVRLTSTPKTKHRCPPRYPPPGSTPSPARPSAWPPRRRPRAPATSEARYRLSAVVFSAACTGPTRVSGPAVSDQSFSPAAAVGTAATTPAVTSRSAAPSAAGPPAASGGADITHAPVGWSVSIGGRGCTGSGRLVRLRTRHG